MEQEKENVAIIPEGTTVIRAYEFDGSTITRVVIPAGVTEIGKGAFRRCENLKQVDIPAGVTVIRESAFAGSGLRSAVIPDSVTEIGKDAFYGCDHLEELILPAGLTRIEDGLCTWCCRLRRVVIPDGVTWIGDIAFAQCGKAEIWIPASVTHIGDSAFETETYPMGNMQLTGIIHAPRGSYAVEHLCARYPYSRSNVHAEGQP